MDHTANLLGALSAAVGDRTSDAIGAAAGQSEAAATALSAMYHFLDSPTVDVLRQVLGLTSSGTVRLVDRLQAAGYVTRGAGRDARFTVISLTPQGRRAARRVAAARAAVLEDALAGLAPEERRTLDDLLSRVLAGLIRGPGAVRWMCRLCDTQSCGRPSGHCPVANAVTERSGPARQL